MEILPSIQLTPTSAMWSVYAQQPSQLLQVTNMHVPVDCHLPCTVPKPAFSDKDYVPRLKAALAACQQMEQQYVAIPATQAPSLYKRGDLILISSTLREKAHKLTPR